jgi:hypothetical protein
MEKAHSSSARRQASSRLERIDSVTEVGPSPAHDRGRSDNATVLPLPSPRALRRAKSSVRASHLVCLPNKIADFLLASQPRRCRNLR